MPKNAPVRSERRHDVLRAVKDATQPIGIAAVGEKLGIHANTARFHLENLVTAGLLERVEPRARTTGRPPALYAPARRMDPGGSRQYRMLAEILVRGLEQSPGGATLAVEAGRDWGRREALADSAWPGEDAARLADVLDRIGFAPERSDGGDEISLRRCPFLEIAQHSRSTVCPVHLGIMQGALEAWGSPVTVTALEPFVEPDRCVARLRGPAAS
ncbi:Predicted transcriptional regulator, ArsR family [Paramicrobacterium humi]|uniref:Predicted transcriptional regulator, ArsR family n=1 Tax=Paramicrobacterium humi TaxID=640635 RepID=A0A1H4NY27_9MICO|nr:helix-turn-helix domain-containing protein [Microbacterium humi]SEC00049.1 Predicted transcriptional regulator, ArsR family [Microbacterium humi]